MRAIVWVKKNPQRAQTRQPSLRRGFTLLDVLVSMAVIAVLIGLMLPALTAIRETSRKVVCSSNIRQLGLSTAMYADDYKGQLPHSAYYEKSLQYNQDPFEGADKLMMARIGDASNKWDGLGILFGRQYCSAAQVYYCPSHKSRHTYEFYKNGWHGAQEDVFTNFQFRGGAPDSVNSRGTSNLNKMPDRISLIADGLASGFDFNHAVGGNIVASDLSVAWFDNTNGLLDLPTTYDAPDAKDKLFNAWELIDRSLGK